MPDGYVLPAGTVISMNAWVVNRQNIFGDDVDDYIIERWLQQLHESFEAHKERLAKMKRVDLTFGAESRSCAGEYIVMLETYKITPTLFLEFDIRLVDKTEEWHNINRWAVWQGNIPCWVRRRERDSKHT